MSLGGFQLHKWCSNDKRLLSDIPKKKLGFSQRDLDQDKPVIKTLGLLYNTQDDVFKMSGDIMTSPEIPEKRCP